MKEKDFLEVFDANEEDIIEYLDLDNIKHVNRKQKRVNVDFPIWMVESLDQEAERVGVTRQAIIKMWLAERLESNASRYPAN